MVLRVPRASRRRRRARGWGAGPAVLVGIAAVLTAVLIVGSLVAIHTQSQDYRSATTTGYGALAARTATDSTQTGSQLAALMNEASGLTNAKFPQTARGILQQGLDSAVQETSDQAAQAVEIASPPPSADLATRFSAVMADRAAATARLRSTIDQLLGMTPLPVAAGPSTTVPASPATLISVGQATAALTAVGALLEQADDDYRQLAATARALRPPVRLPSSVWVHDPVATAPLGSARLGAAAAALSTSAALVPFHHLVITAVGLTPPAVPGGGVGVVGTTCVAPQSTVPGASPTTLPPTKSVAVSVTVTNCGTVPETGVSVTVDIAPADPPGAPALPPGAAGGTSRARVSLASGSSSAPGLSALPVAPGHRYALTVSVSLPAGQVDPTGTTHRFLLQVTG